MVNFQERITEPLAEGATNSTLSSRELSRGGAYFTRDLSRALRKSSELQLPRRAGIRYGAPASRPSEPFRGDISVAAADAANLSFTVSGSLPCYATLPPTALVRLRLPTSPSSSPSLFGVFMLCPSFPLLPPHRPFFHYTRPLRSCAVLTRQRGGSGAIKGSANERLSGVNALTYLSRTRRGRSFTRGGGGTVSLFLDLGHQEFKRSP